MKPQLLLLEDGSSSGSEMPGGGGGGGGGAGGGAEIVRVGRVMRLGGTRQNSNTSSNKHGSKPTWGTIVRVIIGTRTVARAIRARATIVKSPSTEKSSIEHIEGR
jgi:hypothetical protein